jgi:membrane protein implicated in regulation of membrane protease activity
MAMAMDTMHHRLVCMVLLLPIPVGVAMAAVIVVVIAIVSAIAIRRLLHKHNRRRVHILRSNHAIEHEFVLFEWGDVCPMRSYIL